MNQPNTITLTAALAKLEEFARQHQDKLSEEVFESLMDSIVNLSDCIALLKAKL